MTYCQGCDHLKKLWNVPGWKCLVRVLPDATGTEVILANIGRTLAHSSLDTITFFFSITKITDPSNVIKWLHWCLRKSAAQVRNRRNWIKRKIINWIKWIEKIATWTHDEPKTIRSSKFTELNFKKKKYCHQWFYHLDAKSRRKLRSALYVLEKNQIKLAKIIKTAK